MSDDPKIEKPGQVRKLRRGDCGMCHWFERQAEEPQAGKPWVGYCFANPPIIGQQAVPKMTAAGQIMVPQMVGHRPPTLETDRCEKWRPAGTLPPFYDGNFDAIKEANDEIIRQMMEAKKGEKHGPST